MKPFLTDIAVAMIFFNRPGVLEKVFSSVRKARPSKLYLIQDGARENRSNDLTNIQKCREIVSHIDWECEVTKIYSEVNLGCGQRIFSGLTQVFKKEEYAVIVEDDILIGESFLPFCKEMCERYKDDQRIQMIGGMNHLGVYNECPYSYFFSRGGSAIWGWATWRRCWQELQWTLDAASNPYIIHCLNNQTWINGAGKRLASNACSLRNSIVAGSIPSYWSFHFGFYGALNDRLNIVPKYNLISNIGLTGDSAHTANSINKILKRIQCVFYARIYELHGNLIHPDYILDDQYYMKQQEKIMNPAIWRRIIEIPERIFRKLFL